MRSLTSEEAFDIACCDNHVQDLVLPKEFTHNFAKVPDYEAVLNFSVPSDLMVTPEQKEELKRQKKEAKILKLQRREAKKAKIAADIKAKEERKALEKSKNDVN